MSSSENIEKINRLFAEVFTGGNFDVCDELLSPDIKLNDPMAPEFQGGLTAWKEWEGMFQKAFPGKKARIDDIVESGDKLAVRWTVDGKQSGDLPGVPNTGKDITVTGIMIVEFSGGKISQMWNRWDNLGLYQQLGAVQLPQ